MTKNSTKEKETILQNEDKKSLTDEAGYISGRFDFSLKKTKNNSLELIIDKTSPKTFEDKISQEMYQSLGTTNKTVFNNLLSCVSNLYGDDYTENNLNYVVSLIKELRPRDTLETMLITQMIAVHNMTMRSFYRAGLKDQTNYGVEENISRATKFSRTYLAQMDALKKYRSKGDQKITVEHININDGGKAFIGTANTQINNSIEELIKGGVGKNEK